MERPPNPEKLRVPCSYQGGKQRVAPQLVDILLEYANPATHFYDLCCGSGAVSVELVNQGIPPSQITMLDRSSWGAFWQAVGDQTFDVKEFRRLLEEVPKDKHLIKRYMASIASKGVNGNESELYLILQACSFGGKQIWSNGNRWENAYFRDYWQPTKTSVRRSPMNPMQPSPEELLRRVTYIVQKMSGITCLHKDISYILHHEIPGNSIIYIDPPYQETTGYAFGFDLNSFLLEFQKKNTSPVFVSEGFALSPDSTHLTKTGAKGGISGTRKGRHEEWVSRIW